MFRQWIMSAYLSAPNSFQGLIIHHIDELAQTCIFTRLDASGDDVVQQAYFVKMGQAETKIANFSIDQLKPSLRIDGT